MSTVSVALAGSAQSRFGRFPEKRLEDLAWEAIGEALSAASVEPADIEAVYVGNVFGPTGVASRVARAAGIGGVPVIRIEAACASGTVAAHLAIGAVARGECRCALALGIEQLSSLFDGAINPERTDVEGGMGLPLPGSYALMAQHYLRLHKRSAEDLAAVAVKNRYYGARNQWAHRQSEVGLDEVLSSRMVADPLTVLQCCPVSDGAAAAVFTPSTGASGEVVVEGSSVVGGMAWPTAQDDTIISSCVRHAINKVRKRSDFVLTEIDVFEVHDAFTVGEFLALEGLGLCEPGTSPDYLKDGEFHIGGRWPVNVSGGLLARGHALGATGIAQIAEIHRQLVGNSGSRQLPYARSGLVETMGGGAAGLDGNVAAVIILRSLG